MVTAFCALSTTHAQIYKWKDNAGQMHYTETPPKFGILSESIGNFVKLSLEQSKHDATKKEAIPNINDHSASTSQTQQDTTIDNNEVIQKHQNTQKVQCEKLARELATLKSGDKTNINDTVNMERLEKIQLLTIDIYELCQTNMPTPPH